jgi:hypothetical protein
MFRIVSCLRQRLLKAAGILAGVLWPFCVAALGQANNSKCTMNKL